jgi:hypothetical protein
MLSMNLILIDLDFITLNLARSRGCHKLSATNAICFKSDFVACLKNAYQFKCMNYGPFSRVGYLLKMMPSSSGF